MSIQSLRDSIEHKFKASARQIKEALAEVGKLESELANTRFVMDKRGDEVELLRANLAISEERQTAMRAALEQIEWVHIDGDMCPWCGGLSTRGHKTDCARQLALKAATAAA